MCAMTDSNSTRAPRESAQSEFSHGLPENETSWRCATAKWHSAFAHRNAHPKESLMRNVSNNAMNSDQFSGISPVRTSEWHAHPLFPEKSIFRTIQGESLI